MLMIKETTKPKYHQYIVLPAESFAFPRQKANATSNKPAMIKITQFTNFLGKGLILDHVTGKSPNKIRSANRLLSITAGSITAIHHGVHINFSWSKFKTIVVLFNFMEQRVNFPGFRNSNQF